jgi:hypothetical protein
MDWQYENVLINNSRVGVDVVVAGFMILGGLIIYSIISLLAVWLGVSVAREQGKSGWKGGLFMATVMYLILFWDLIPFRVAHKYYCLTEGGYTLNKTLEEWQRENPDVANTLVSNKNLTTLTIDGGERYLLNQRLAWDIYTSKGFLDMRKKDERIVDIVNGEVLARYVDFDSNQRSHDYKSLRDFEIWIYIESCEVGNGMPEKIRFNDYFSTVSKLEGISHGSK